VADADGAVVGRSLRVPRVDKASSAEGKAIAAVGVADFENLTGNAFTFPTSSLKRECWSSTTESNVTGRA